MDKLVELQHELERKIEAGEITLGQAILQIRTRHFDFTQAEFARLCRVSEKTVRDIEKGNTDPRLSIVERMLNMGGLSLSVYRKISLVRPKGLL